MRVFPLCRGRPRGGCWPTQGHSPSFFNIDDKIQFQNFHTVSDTSSYGLTAKEFTWRSSLTYFSSDSIILNLFSGHSLCTIVIIKSIHVVLFSQAYYVQNVYKPSFVSRHSCSTTRLNSNKPVYIQGHTKAILGLCKELQYFLDLCSNLLHFVIGHLWHRCGVCGPSIHSVLLSVTWMLSVCILYLWDIQGFRLICFNVSCRVFRKTHGALIEQNHTAMSIRCCSRIMFSFI